MKLNEPVFEACKRIENDINEITLRQYSAYNFSSPLIAYPNPSSSEETIRMEKNTPLEQITPNYAKSLLEETEKLKRIKWDENKEKIAKYIEERAKGGFSDAHFSSYLPPIKLSGISEVRFQKDYFASLGFKTNGYYGWYMVNLDIFWCSCPPKRTLLHKITLGLIKPTYDCEHLRADCGCGR